MSARATLAVIFGGRSPEHEVSVVSARSIMREADPARFEAVPFGITRGGAWLAPAETRRRLEAIEAGRADHLGDERPAGPFAAGDVLAALAAADAAFPIVHGRTGDNRAESNKKIILDTMPPFNRSKKKRRFAFLKRVLLNFLDFFEIACQFRLPSFDL